MKTLKYLLLIVLVSSTLNIYPQDFWQQTNGPTGGNIKFVAANSSGHIFAKVGEQNLIVRSTDNGITWIEANEGLPVYIGFLQITPDDIIFITAGASGLYRSTDNGDSWTQVLNQNIVSGYFSPPLVYNSNGHLFIGASNGVYRSTDNGATWQQTSLSNVGVNNLGINDSGYVFAAVDYSGIFRSTDSGDSWTLINNGIQSYPYTNTFYLSPTGSIFIVIFDDWSFPMYGIYRSNDNGNNWVRTDNNLPSNAYVTSLSINSDGDVFASTAFLGVYRSIDNGDSWTETNNGLTSFAFRSPLLFNSTGALFANTGAGVFRSTDNGDNWGEVNNGLKFKESNSLIIGLNDILINGSVGGIFSSTDNGNYWQDLNTDIINTSITSLVTNSNGDVFAGSVGMHRSTNNGDNWEVIFPEFVTGIALGAPDNIFAIFGNSAVAGYSIYRSLDNGLTWLPSFSNGQSFAITANTSGSVVAGGFGKVFRSTDNGDNWSTSTLPVDEQVLSIAINPYGHIFASVLNYGMYRSTDNGVTWLPSGLQGLYNYSNCITRINSDGIIFAGTDIGLFRSSDNGNSWTRVTDFFVSAIAFSLSGEVFIGSDKAYRSTDNGDNWTEISSGLPETYIQSLYVDDDGYVYSGTYDKGVYRSLQSTTSIEDDNLNSPATFALEQNYPNPFNPSTTIRYSVPSVTLSEVEGSRVSLKVYDVLGNEVATLVNEEKPAGNYEVDFNATGLSSGIYFYKLQAGSLLETKKMILMK